MSPRVILITGGNGAMGLAVARAFLDAPCSHKIILGVRSHRDHAAELAKTNAERCELIDLDVTSAAAWRDAVATIQTKHQRVDVLVNNAGHHEDHLLATMPDQAWRSVIESNLTGVYHGCQSVLRPMISQRWGRIVNVSSLSALLAPAGQTNYAAAKAGVVALTQSLAKEVARIGITVNAVCPGYIESGNLLELSKEERRQTQSRIPMRRLGRPEEVAAAVAFLASEQASYITGAALKVDGGIF